MNETNPGGPRRLYLDLLIRAIANTIYGDANMDRWNPHIFDAGLRADGRDWPSVAHSMVGLARLENLRTLVERALAEDVPGDLIETGVWRGGCCILMRGVLAAYGAGRRVYVADSFRGLPPPRPEDFPADASDRLYTFDELAVSQTQVRENFARYGLLDEQVVFVEGLFQDTLPRLQVGPFALIRLDGDMYESTLVALENLYPRLSPGGFAVIDDYGAIAACRAAVEDYRAREGITAEIHRVDWTGVWWRKPAV
jgi:O-methyltransferase